MLKLLEGGLGEVNGYKFAATECGIRYNDRLDYSLIFSEKPCIAAGMFTTNKLPAAPVRLCKQRINNSIHGILINSTNANACTGEEGYNNSMILTGDIARQLNVDSSSILMASTGVIGHQLPVEKMMAINPLLVRELSLKNAELIPKAIMTTDTFPKVLALSFSNSFNDYRMAGTAKGAGMIAPNMATLLSFIITDFPVSKKDLKIILKRCVDRTLNLLTIDGEMSTNDTIIILSPISDQYQKKQKDLNQFEDALEYLLSRLSEMIVMDGEGATRMVKVKVSGAKTKDDAKMAAKAISESILVKTALFGRDPNWGRIACAVGYSGAFVKEKNLSIHYEHIPILTNGIPNNYDKHKLDEILSRNNFTIYVNLGIGKFETIYLTTDISYDYIKINSEYAT